MKIVHVTDTYLPTIGGIEVLVSELARRQIDLGHDVTVVCRTPDGNSALTVCGPEPAPTVRTKQLPHALLRSADVVHAHVSFHSPMAMAAASYASRRKIPSLVTVHSMWTGATWLVRLATLSRRWHTLPIQWSAVSECAADSVRQGLGSGTQVLMVPNAVDLAQWRPPATNLDSDQQPITAVAVLRMAHRKRPVQLIKMLAQARSLIPAEIPVNVILAGDGPLRHKVQHTIDRYGHSEWISAPGALTQDQLRTVYRHANIFIAPANLESFGIAALEARSCGLAVIAKSHTGIADFVRHEQEGLLCRDDADMAHAIARLCTDPELRTAIQTHNQAKPPTFGWDEALAKVWYAYQRAAALHQLPVVAQPHDDTMRPQADHR